MEAAIAAKQAGLDAENKARQVKTEAALATLAQVAKAEVLQVKASVLEQGLLGNTFPPDVTTEDPVTKVDSYLNTQIINIAAPSVLTRESAVANNYFVSQPEITEVSAPKVHYLPSTEVTSQAAAPLHDISQTKLEQSLPVDTQDSMQSNYTMPTTAFSLNPKAASWVPENPQIQTNSGPTLQQSSVPLDILNYTSYRNPRRDLADRGIQKFSDKPEDYMLWKNTFQSALKQLKLPVEEELNLLIAWLGPASSIQVKRIYAANINNPHAALNRVWDRLNERYGSSAQIETLLLQKLKSFPAFTKGEYEKLWDYADLLEELEAAKGNPDLPGLACLDQYLTQQEIIDKLPFSLKEVWGREVFSYKETHQRKYPPFTHLVKFLLRSAREKNDLQTGFPLLYQSNKKDRKHFIETKSKPQVTVRKTETKVKSVEHHTKISAGVICPVHQIAHDLNNCKEFRSKPYEERLTFARDQRLCFKCGTFRNHIAKECRRKVKCQECFSEKHCSALHRETTPHQKGKNSEKSECILVETPQPKEVKIATSTCTALCGEAGKERTCHPICLVDVYPENSPDQVKRMYVALDSQSDTSLATPEFFNIFQIQSKEVEYVMTTCGGDQVMVGRVASGFILRTIDGMKQFRLPTFIECQNIPKDERQIPTREIAMSHAHLRSMAHKLPRFDPGAKILLLIGIDCPDLFSVKKQIKGRPGAPIAQELEIGWTILGPVCLNRKRLPSHARTFCTSFMPNGRPTQMLDCRNHIQIRFQNTESSESSVFRTTVHDNLIVLSKENNQQEELLVGFLSYANSVSTPEPADKSYIIEYEESNHIDNRSSEQPSTSRSVIKEDEIEDMSTSQTALQTNSSTQRAKSDIPFDHPEAQVSVQQAIDAAMISPIVQPPTNVGVDIFALPAKVTKEEWMTDHKETFNCLNHSQVQLQKDSEHNIDGHKNTGSDPALSQMIVSHTNFHPDGSDMCNHLQAEYMTSQATTNQLRAELAKEPREVAVYEQELQKLPETKYQLEEAHGQLKEQKQLSNKRLLVKEQQVANLQIKPSYSEEKLKEIAAVVTKLQQQLNGMRQQCQDHRSFRRSAQQRAKVLELGQELIPVQGSLNGCCIVAEDRFAFHVPELKVSFDRRGFSPHEGGSQGHRSVGL
nr:PREDICTED: uncharacterized protein LOC107983578 [Anolis carolinensis]|eukprot:XP_016853166.1 PREDICTED: uncharacterized protein LOC107983578 [Anolis carolinensis]